MFTFIAAALVLGSATFSAGHLDSEEKSDPVINKRAAREKYVPAHTEAARRVPVTTFGIEAFSEAGSSAA